MSGLELAGLVAGATLMAYAVAGFFFLRFWKQTGDRFFAIFGASFLMLGLQRLLVSLTPQDYENLPYLYIVRLLAYVFILVAIVDKNRARQRG
jgi:hypothetical protein